MCHPLPRIRLGMALVPIVVIFFLTPAGGRSATQGGKLIDDRQITIKSDADVTQKRQALLKFIWGVPNLPSGQLPLVEKNDKSPVGDLSNLERLDTLTIVMEAGQKSYAHHFIPKRKNNQLVVFHHGHAPSFNDSAALTDQGYGMHRTIDGLLRNGYSVLAVYMPHIVKFDTRLTVDDVGKISHDQMFATIKVEKGSVMKFFLEPVAVCLHYLKTRSAADDFPVYQDFHMAGLSGGGWTTTVYAAIDPTIKMSFPVAGSIPLYLRFKGSVGDTEQTLSSFYQIAGYPDLYVLGSHGAGRKQVQILNRLDDCCFGENQHQANLAGGMSYDAAMRSYEKSVRLALFNLGPKNLSSFFRLEIDEAAPAHMISWNAVVNTILAELNGGRPYIGAASATDVFVRGMNGNLWHLGAKGWQDTGFPMVGVPAVVQGAVNAIDVFYRNPRNELMHAYSTGAAWKNELVKGTIITDPAAIASEAGKIDIVAFGRNYKLYHWRMTGAGVSPFKLVEASAPGLGNPALVSRVPTQLDVLYRGFDGGLHQVHATGDPPTWAATRIDGTLLDFPTAVAAPDGSLRVYMRNQSSKLVEAAQAKKDGPWQWTTISDLTGGQLIAGSPSASVQGGVIKVHARTPSGNLATFTLSKTWSFANHGRSMTGSPSATPGGAFVRDEAGRLWFNDGAKWLGRDGLFD